MIDTHSHIYSEEFDNDRDEVIQRAKDAGVTKIILPNVDSESLPRMLSLEKAYPGYCYAAIGLHPTSVKDDYKNELDIIKRELSRRKYIAIGEIGIDLYWDKSFYNEQLIAFTQQLQWSLDYNLPVIIHVRDSFRETMNALEPFRGKGLRGVFHSFTGSIEQADEIIQFGGFYMGINGIVTFKNSELADTLKHVQPEHILTETDAPYLTPAPYRGKRNEPAHIAIICEKLSAVYELEKEKIIEITSCNSFNLFEKSEPKS
ncbi:MAG: TatD family hydrolase [Paludibacter sp.]|jgi:TatD DNase family protein|nr:TatD family hydrolase [Paludibacter sp.]